MSLLIFFFVLLIPVLIAHTTNYRELRDAAPRCGASFRLLPPRRRVLSGMFSKSLKKGKNQSKETETSVPPAEPVATDPKDLVTIAIHADPRSKQNAVTVMTTKAVGVVVGAPPSKGDVNGKLRSYLSRVLELRNSDEVLDKCGKSLEKMVKLLASGSRRGLGKAENRNLKKK
ncbi:UPF0235 protein C15orf40 homolog [Acomys russatus]|uniref:UPF0235 protein C15orf40 homolog n=1 Tax=Acomys russatus TaxID=60746 RepID=UPI0021E2F230|nr:UPF0235 protein C15orf40 homolog [Acomys russatus]